MTELERRALLGDRKAQEECTRRGIVLVCPRCEKGGASTKYVMGDYWYECPHCHSASGFHSSAEVALADWNTRPAPPVGRCGECGNACDVRDNLLRCDIFNRDMMPDDFCSQFEPKGGEENAR